MNALIIVDLQNDFCPGGALAVNDGDTIIEGINQLARQFEIVITTQDYHPQNHGSFASNHPGAKVFDVGTLSGRPQILWPDHCVQNTKGSDFHESLQVDAVNFPKGTNPLADSYSGFFDDDGASTGLVEFLRKNQVSSLYICGLATDYCVKFTTLDAIDQKFDTAVVVDLCKAVNMSPGDDAKAIAEMAEAGAIMVQSSSIHL